MGKPSQSGCTDMKMVDALSTLLIDQRTRDGHYAAIQRRKEAERKLGWPVKGDVMVVHTLRVPKVQKEWLKNHKEASEEIRWFIVGLMEKEREHSNNNTTTCTVKGDNKNKVLLCNHKEVILLALPPRTSVTVVDAETPESDGWAQISANKGTPVLNTTCPKCKKPLSSPIWKTKEGLMIHEECREDYEEYDGVFSSL